MPGVVDSQKYYCPMYSEEVSNNYALKNLEEKDIIGLHEKIKNEAFSRVNISFYLQCSARCAVRLFVRRTHS